MTAASASGSFPIAGDLEVHRLAFGAMRITGEGIWGPPADVDEARACAGPRRRAGHRPDRHGRLLRAARQRGAHRRDAGPYPPGLVITTKGGLERTGPGQWPRNGRPEHLRRACEGSLRRLKLDRIDLYQMHRHDPEVPYEESIGALKELQDEGKIKHIGVSNVDLRQLDVARGIVDVATVQNRFGLTDRHSDDVLAVCERDGIGFLPWAPLGGGTPASDKVVDEIADRHGTTPIAVAIAWLLRRSPVMMPIPGTSSVAHLEENVAAASLELERRRGRAPRRARRH